ncbi:MAG: hypothetical protein ACMUIP_18345 [bacterium]
MRAENKKEGINKIIQTGKPLRSENEINGMWFDTIIFPITDASAEIIKLAIIARDITERKKAEEVLIRDKEDIEKIVNQRTKELLITQEEFA